MSLLSRLAVQAARAYGILSARSTNISASYLVVAGGGSGGGSWSAGGGGAGGMLASTTSLSTLNTYSITVGAGGASTSGANGTQGNNSVISGTGLSTITSTGGGYGAVIGGNGGNGGSGGGAGSNATTSGGTATAGQGNNGGSNIYAASPYPSAGGGGAGAVGANSTSTTSGAGGNGLSSSISGSSVTYAGGGGGGANQLYGGTAGAGGTGGGGAGGSPGSNGTPGTTNTGGGGGGCGATSGIGGQGGSGIVIISYASATPKFVGGTLTTSGGNQIHTFTSSGTLSPLTPVTASYLVVAGGGGGGRQYGGQGAAGGGGAGGLLTSSTTLYSGATYVVTVGAGGAGGSSAGAAPNGSDSVISGTGLTTLTATGGGGGAGSSGSGASGGSGGGGQGETAPKTGGSGTSGQGNAGGAGVNAGGGGGGASAAGTSAVLQVPGVGGAGTASSISGSSVTYAGGGGGGGYGTNTGGVGGAGGGGQGQTGSSTTPAVSGTTNLGGGGGGAGYVATGNYNGGAGGSGTVIISYAGSQVFNGGLVTSSGGNTIHTFTATGALTPLTNNLNNSLRFRGSNSAYLNRTPSVASNRKTWTWSAWIKLGTISVNMGTLFGAQGQTAIYLNDGTNYSFRINGAAGSDLITNLMPRDPAAWYHLVVACDTTQATEANRLKIYVNGNQQTSFQAGSAYPTLNGDTYFNSTALHTIGRRSWNSDQQFDGYMTDINFIDGQALEPYYFGNNDAYGNWKPIKYTGMYGTNGFYLTFGNTTSTTTLGYDSSPNGNNWTCNNISLTAGTTYDAMLDVPTNTSATVGNFPVYDQLTPSSISGSAVRSISAGNLYVTNSGPNGWSAIGTTMVMTSGSGKWYWEVTCSGTTSNGTMIGIHRPFTSTSTFPSAILGYTGDADGYGYYMGGNKYNNSGAGVAYGASYTAGDVIGVALDMSTAGSASITFYKNNTSQGVAFSSLTGDFFAAVSQAQSNGLDINFGQRPFSYTPPSGFVALNTFNLPTPTILQGNKYMDATVYSGSSTSGRLITNAALFQPDFVWVKNRTLAGRNHQLFDSVRGANKGLFSNLTNAESTTTQDITAFNSNGFTVGNDNNVNSTGDNFVGWQWQAGQGSTSSNTSGSITSTVSVNTTAGFSIVTYTGTGANATVGHGLGVAPKMVIVKCRSAASSDWMVYHASANASPATGVLQLNTTIAFTATSTTWNNTAPTSSVFSVGTNNPVNQSSQTFVAYCWAEIAGFSKFGSYVGNGSTDGTFVFTGFRPKYVLLKSTGVENWFVFDSSRNTYNVTTARLYPALSNAEDTNLNTLDLLSNGFKFRDTNAAWNSSGQTYIYACFAENPFKNSNAR